MFRAEEMLALSGPIHLEEQGGNRRVVNGGDLELRDAILIDMSGPKDGRERWLGTIAAGATVAIDEPAGQGPPERIVAGPGPDANAILAELRTSHEVREENQGEIRLVAWVAGTRSGQVIEPAIDRRRGFTAVVVHLRSGPPPSPDGRRYNRQPGDRAVDARAPEQAKPTAPRAPRGPVPNGRRRTQPTQPGRAKTNG
jgi:hypothetical protein